MPDLEGEPVSLSFRPDLSAHRGKLLSRKLEKGTPVHAAAFIRQRRIVLETALFKDRQRLQQILVHELFHFVWARLGNHKRAEFSAILRRELERNARGELGEAAAVKKARLQPGDHRIENRRWRDYLCESFCDTAAWYHTGVNLPDEVTLGRRWSKPRARWIDSIFQERRSF